MEHRFYKKTTKERIQIQVLIAVSASAVSLTAIFLSWKTGVYLIGFLFLAIVLSIIAPFFDVPALRKRGKLVYYSSLFIIEPPKNGVVKIHGGTLFDYAFVLPREMNGRQRTTLIIQQYLQGLLHFIEKYEDTPDVNLKTRGTSYILNERTAESIGFKITKTNLLQKLILIYNFFNLLIANSMAKKSFSWPKLNETKTFEAGFNELLERKNYIAQLNSKLKNNIYKKG